MSTSLTTASPAVWFCPQGEAQTSRFVPSPTAGHLFLPVFPDSPTLLRPHIIHSHLGAFCSIHLVCGYQHASLPTGNMHELRCHSLTPLLPSQVKFLFFKGPTVSWKRFIQRCCGSCFYCTGQHVYLSWLTQPGTCFPVLRETWLDAT